jgi:hypothetical protein
MGFSAKGKGFCGVHIVAAESIPISNLTTPSYNGRLSKNSFSSPFIPEINTRSFSLVDPGMPEPQYIQVYAPHTRGGHVVHGKVV